MRELSWPTPHLQVRRLPREILPGTQLRRCQYLCFCTSTASKLSTCALECGELRLPYANWAVQATASDTLAQLPTAPLELESVRAVYTRAPAHTHTHIHTHTHTHTQACKAGLGRIPIAPITPQPPEKTRDCHPCTRGATRLIAGERVREDVR